MNTFHSTRGNDEALTSKQAIRRGLAADGGLYIDDDLGSRTLDASTMVGASYQRIATTVLAALLPDFSAAELDECVGQAYGPQWADAAVTPLKPLGDDYMLELFNGPTSAFKDVALQMLPRLMARTAGTRDERAEKIMILTATSGDTGKAALAGFAGVGDTGITVFYPEGKVSAVQRLQMTTQQGDNVNVRAVRGNFDDAQSAVKRIFADEELSRSLAREHRVTLSSANSINIGRLAPQVVYYFSAYTQLVDRGAIHVGDAVEFCVPTGNFGDVLAGYYAKMLGLPVSRLTVASDRNNVLFDFLTTGTYDRNRPFYQTTSPSMDILVSSNLERMLYYMTGKDTRLIRTLMDDLAHRGAYDLPKPWLSRVRSLFGCGWADESQVRDAIRSCWREHGTVIDPHTACGYAVMQRIPRVPGVPRVLLSTASPYKFPRVVGEALGINPAPNGADGDDFAFMDALSRFAGTDAPSALRDLEHAVARFTETVDIAQMSDVVRQAAATI